MKVVLLIVISLVSAGCATHAPISKLPDSEIDYKLGKNELVKKYPDIAEYETEWRGFSPNWPLEKDVVEQLGAPIKVERDWWYPVVVIGTALAINAGPFTWSVLIAMRPDTPKIYYFEKDNYCIKAAVDRTIVNGYEPYMYSWEWEENSSDCKTQL